MENVRNHMDIKLITSNKRTKRLVSKSNYHSHKRFSKHLMTIEMKKANVKMNKSTYLGMSTLDISKTLVCEFWHDYIKPKYGDRAKICYTDTDSFVIYIITEDFFEDIADDVKTLFDTSSFHENDKRSLPIDKNEKTPGPFKLELGGQIVMKVVALRAKTWSYLVDDRSEHKKAKVIKKAIIKNKFMFENYKKC